MNEEEKFLFDLNGYLVVEQMLTPDQVRALNEAIDAIRPEGADRSDPSLANGAEMFSGAHGRGQFGGINYPEPWCRPFRELMAHPRTLRFMIDTIGVDLRWEGETGLSNIKGSEGQILHGGGFSHSPDLEIGFFHRVQFDKIRNGLVAIQYLLSDVDEGHGGFTCIPGSHKTNFDCPWSIRHLETGREHARQLVAKAGDAIIFTEALIHGALPWVADHERRVLIHRYGPGIMAFSAPTPPDEAIAAMSPLHEALLKPPSFPNRTDFAQLLDEAGR